MKEVPKNETCIHVECRNGRTLAFDRYALGAFVKLSELSKGVVVPL